MEKDKYNELVKNNNQRLQPFRPENPLILEEKLKNLEADVLKILLQELKSTKNWLLIEEKMYSNPMKR